MNAFVNTKKRGIGLPNGAKDLIDVLSPPKLPPSLRFPEACKYCGAPSCSLPIFTRAGRLCSDCFRDNQEFGLAINFDRLTERCIEIGQAEALAESKQRYDQFMRDRVEARKTR